jgi:hypothetical protein
MLVWSVNELRFDGEGCRLEMYRRGLSQGIGIAMDVVAEEMALLGKDVDQEVSL